MSKKINFDSWFKEIKESNGINEITLLRKLGVNFDFLLGIKQRKKLKPHEVIIFEKRLNISIPDELKIDSDKNFQRPKVEIKQNKQNKQKDTTLEQITEVELFKRLNNLIEKNNGVICPYCNTKFSNSEDKVIGPNSLYYHKECYGKELKERDAIAVNSIIFDIPKIRVLYESNINRFKNGKCLSRQTLKRMLEGEPVENKTYRKFAQFVGVEIEDIMKEPYKQLVKKGIENKLIKR